MTPRLRCDYCGTVYRAAKDELCLKCGGTATTLGEQEWWEVPGTKWVIDKGLLSSFGRRGQYIDMTVGGEESILNYHTPEKSEAAYDLIIKSLRGKSEDVGR